MEKILNDICKKYIRLNQSEVEANNVILTNFLDEFIPAMREADDLFNQLYTELYYGGSYYDGLKITKPNEYDLDLKLVIPKHINSQVRVDEKRPGYVQITFFNPYNRYLAATDKPTRVSNTSRPKKLRFRDLFSLVDRDRYLNTPRVLNWMKSVVQNTINGYSAATFGKDSVRVRMTNGGPAITLSLTGSTIDDEISLDLVPCFVLPQSQWPGAPFRRNNVPHKTNFFAVSKPLKEPHTDRYCRLSFQEQEGQLIKGKAFLKPAVKLLKRIRDKYNHPIPSYYIKTVALWMVDEKDKAFWSSSLTDVFTEMLRRYNRYLKDKLLPYYWNPANDLFQDVNDVTLDNIYHLNQRLLNTMDKSPWNIEKFFGENWYD
ncbi:hypothetical protein GWI33_016426 [Rhynchophorus ferrugineus]|uniref:Cyclic GMP-AMP synthase n=1 Tax=Rhynchophorus ferrugineus TaxID=354439 RepID=A0A834M8P9_RHYFE|nr:hypothetical protein GWI33_016426 [Rhynchophorus ferrugineus]